MCANSTGVGLRREMLRRTTRCSATRLGLLFVALIGLGGPRLNAHPMGNFSVNHYARIQPDGQIIRIQYVLDLAELPTLQMLQKWDLTKDSATAKLQAAARREALHWMGNLVFLQDGKAVAARLDRVEASTQDGAGGLPVLRVVSDLRTPQTGSEFDYEDRNFPDRAGWKEIVIDVPREEAYRDIFPAGRDRSAALTAYPQDPTLAPPQDLRAHFASVQLRPEVTSLSPASPRAPKPEPSASADVRAAVAERPAARVGPAPAEPNSLGAVKRNDLLSRTLKESAQSLPFTVALLCLLISFGLGALHALEPGHGKTMVAAYLVGSRGTIKHAAMLGGLVTFTHTASVFLLGFVTLFLSKYILPESLMKMMGTISGVTIVWIGGLLLWRRLRKLLQPGAASGAHHHHSHTSSLAGGHSHQGHDHQHHHHAHENHHSHGPHDHSHGHSHSHAHGHSHSHAHEGHHQSHAAHGHHHLPEGEVTLGSLFALGVSGGLLPCPAALVILLSCISIGRAGFGLLLLCTFSAGLALVLMLIGFTVLLLKKSVSGGARSARLAMWARFAPVVSAASIFVIGIYMTGVAMGLLPVLRGIG